MSPAAAVPPLLAPLATWQAFWIITAANLVLVAGFAVVKRVRARHTDEPTLDGRKRGYTAAEALDAIERMGPEGRRLYRVQELTLDLLFPLAYALWFACVVALAFKAIGARGWWWLECALPFTAAAFDYLENACVLTLIRRFGRGERPLGVARTAAFATLAKFRLIWFSYALVLAVLMPVAIAFFV